MPFARAVPTLVHQCPACMVRFHLNTNTRIDALEGGSELCAHSGKRAAVIVELYIHPYFMVPEASLKQDSSEDTPSC